MIKLINRNHESAAKLRFLRDLTNEMGSFFYQKILRILLPESVDQGVMSEDLD
jgi:hypothetical protein